MRTLRLTALLVCWLLLPAASSAQRTPGRSPALSADRAKSGALVLEAFGEVARSVRDSVVSFQVDGKDVALGAIIDPDGLVLTKASEISAGKLTCRLSNGQQLSATRLAEDEDSDVALIRIHSTGLKVIRWASEEATVGQWAVTPGTAAVPAAVGIVSAPQRRILPQRAIIGVLPDFNASTAQVREVMPGLGAEKAGLKPGDIIIAVNDLPVNNGEELVTTLRNFREGQTVKLRLRRDGNQLELAVPMTIPKTDRAGRGFARQERMNRLGSEVSRRAEGFELALQHDTVLQPWQCGGPLVNLDGKSIGLNIARAGRIASYALPASLVRDLIDQLKKQAK